MTLLLAAYKRKRGDNSTIDSPEEALQLLEEITFLTDKIRKTPGLEEGKVEEIEKGIDGILRNYSKMNPRRPTRFLRDLTEIASTIENAYNENLLSEKQRKILEYTLKKTKIRDFWSARRLLTKFAKPIELKKERDLKHDQYRSYHRKLEARFREIKAEITKTKNVPKPERSPKEIREIEEIVKEYNSASAGAFVNFIAQSPCIDAISMALRASSIQGLGFPAPRDRASITALLKALEEEHVCKAFGSESLTKLVEVSGYSDKRLEHFVKDYKWFQRKLQENADWLSEVSTQGGRSLEIQWQTPADELSTRIAMLQDLINTLPNADRALKALSKLDNMLRDGKYESALRSIDVYKTFGESAESKYNGTLTSEIADLEKELTNVEKLLKKLPPLDKIMS